jgi:hypothetical protein
LSLTTPVPRDDDAVFPGESWFYYWKTSASLWRSKLALTPSRWVMVPLNWSFHSETGDTYDFAQHRPETDLKKLTSIADELGKKIVFMLPLGPAPFLPNGGLPHLLARTMSLSEEKLGLAVVDSEGGLNKLYTFYDTRVYQAFTRFTYQLAQYFSEQGINSDIWGMRPLALKEGGARSFMEDRSLVFDQSFSRFLKAKREEEEIEVQTAAEEEVYRNDYRRTIERLYEDNAQRTLDAYWEGVFEICFLGADHSDTFNRIVEQDSEQKYCWDVLESMTRDMIPSSVLLNQRVKKGVLEKQLKELVENSFLPMKLYGEEVLDEDVNLFRPLCFFEVAVQSALSSLSVYDWNDLGLLGFLRNEYPYSYRLKDYGLHEVVTSQQLQDRIAFFLGDGLDRSLFHAMLKLFMSGGQVVFDRSHLDHEFEKKLEVFFLENSLKVEKVNFHTSISNIILGQGRLLIFEGDELSELPRAKQDAFWSKVLETFELRSVQIENAKEVVHLWRTRAASAHELNYEEIRRLSLYNPSSYKKKIVLKHPRHFALMKVIDPVNSDVYPGQEQLEMVLLPEGSVSLDFGVFS